MDQPGQNQQPPYGQPPSGSPSYGQPGYGQPPYGNPSYGQPGYNPPQYGGRRRCQPYTVQRGDTFSSIASQNNIPVDFLTAANPDALLRSGQNICIPTSRGRR